MTGNNAMVCNVTNARTLNKLTGDGQFVCERCGAKAHHAANVCVPVPSEPDH